MYINRLRSSYSFLSIINTIVFILGGEAMGALENLLADRKYGESGIISELMLINNFQLYKLDNKLDLLKSIGDTKIVRGTVFIEKNTGIVNIANKYYIKPQMTLEEILKSNLYSILIENREAQKECFTIRKLKHLYFKTIYTGEYYIALTIQLDNNKLSKIYLNTVNPKYPYQNEDWINRIHHCDVKWCNNNLVDFLKYFLKGFIKSNQLEFKDDDKRIIFNKGYIDYLVNRHDASLKRSYSVQVSFLNI